MSFTMCIGVHSKMYVLLKTFNCVMIVGLSGDVYVSFSWIEVGDGSVALIVNK